MEDEAAPAEQPGVSRRQPGAARRCAPPGLADDDDREQDRRQPEPRRDDHDRLPAEGVGEPAADRRRDHRADDIGGGQVSDHLRQPVGAIDVAHHGAGENHPAGAAEPLQDAPGDQHLHARRRRADRRPAGEQHEPADQRRQPADAVGQRAVDQGAQRHREHRQAEGELRGAGIDREGAPDEGDRREEQVD